MPPKPAIHLKDKTPSLLIHVPGMPKTGGEQFAPFCDKVSDAIRRASLKAGLSNIDDAVQVTGIFCLSSHLGRPGQVVADPIDLDNMASPFLSLLKRRAGGPLADNASVAIFDGLKLRQHAPASILELRVIKNRRVAGNPHLRARNYDPLIRRFYPDAALRKVSQPVLPKGAAEVLDFMVPGKIFPAGSHERQLELYKQHILECARTAAADSNFVNHIPRDALVHATVVFCYSDRAESGQLKITSPDLLKLLKPTLDALRGRESGMLMEDDDQVVSLHATKMSAQHHDAVYIQLRIVRGPNDLKPPRDIPLWMAACDAQQMRALAEHKPILIAPRAVTPLKQRRAAPSARQRSRLMEMRA